MRSQKQDLQVNSREDSLVLNCVSETSNEFVYNLLDKMATFAQSEELNRDYLPGPKERTDLL